MLGKLLPLIILGVINILLGVVVWARDNRKMSNASFLGLTVSIGLWCIGIAAFYMSEDAATALVWTRFYYAAPAALVSFLVVFALTFPDKMLKSHQVLAIFTPFLLFFVGLVVNPHFIVHSITSVDGTKDVILDTVNYIIYCAFIVVFFLAGLSVLAHNRKQGGEHKKQLTFFLIGSIVPAVLGITFNLLLPLLGNYRVIWAGPLGTSIFALFVGMNIVLNKMFDIRVFVVRALAYSMTTLMLAAVYIAPVIYVMMLSLGVEFSWLRFLVAILIGTIVALNYHRLRAKFNRLTNRIFFRDVYEPGVLLAQLNKSLVETIDIDRLLHSTTTLLNNAFKPEFCVSMMQNSEGSEIFRNAIGSVNTELDNRHLGTAMQHMKTKTIRTSSVPLTQKVLREYLESMNIQAVTRLTIIDSNNRQAEGFVVLGPRKSGLPYATADLQVLDTVGDTLMIALQNALRFEEIRRFNVTLQERVDEATHKLRTTNDKLKKLDETKDEFITMASHQLRTPLTSVKGYLSMVLEGDVGTLNPQQKQMLTQSYMSSQRMVFLISDLLNLSRLNTGKFVIERTPVDLDEIVRLEIDQLRETAKAREVELLYKTPDNFPKIMLDETKTHQVVMNLLDNAIYYTRPGGSVTIELNETPTSVEYLVKDNGIGVPRAEQHHLFTKFYRANNAKQARPDGTGLGLFMAKKVIAAQGGSIVFRSEEGKGSTFGFRFAKPTHAVHPTADKKVLPTP